MSFKHVNRLSVLLIVLSFSVGGLMVFTASNIQKAKGHEASHEKSAEPYIEARSMVEAGKYLVITGGCNDCHTPGYRKKEGQVPESKWLTGSPVGWKGPWGTTYPTNLRLYVRDLSETEWVERMKTLKTRPPMPWFNLRKMSRRDLRAMYQYIQHLGPKGKPMPNYVPPGEDPKTPFINAVPQKPK